MADFEEDFLKGAGYGRVFCLGLATKVRLTRASEKDRVSLVGIESTFNLSARNHMVK